MESGRSTRPEAIWVGRLEDPVVLEVFPAWVADSREGLDFLVAWDTPAAWGTPVEVTPTQAGIPAAGAQEDIRQAAVGMMVGARERVCQEGRFKTLLWK